MKFTIEREQFLQAILNVNRITLNKVNPILSNVKIDCTDDEVTLITHNCTLTLCATVKSIIDDKEIIHGIEPGSILVNSKLLCDIARSFEGKEISFEILDGSLAKVESDNASFKIGAISSTEFFEVDLSKDGIKIEIKASDLLDAANQVAFCASDKSSRPILSAVNLECNSGMLVFTATDGARLGRKQIEVSSTDLFSVNVPAKSLIEAVKTITNETFVNIYISDKRVAFEFNNSLFITSLIPGDYPNVKNIIPKNFYYFLEVNANEFLKAIEMGAITSKERENIVKITMEQGKVSISSKSQQTGSSEIRIDLFRYKGDRMEMSFNTSYVGNAIRCLKSQDVLLSFVGEMRPFTISNKEDESVIQLITPVRTY